jgi:hypothetical protein
MAEKHSAPLTSYNAFFHGLGQLPSCHSGIGMSGVRQIADFPVTDRSPKGDTTRLESNGRDHDDIHYLERARKWTMGQKTPSS